MSKPDKLFSLEEAEFITGLPVGDQQDEDGNTMVALARQLADTMRELQATKEALEDEIIHRRTCSSRIKVALEYLNAERGDSNQTEQTRMAETKIIHLTHKGNILEVLVDAEDYPVLSRHTWHLTGPKGYPATFLELESGKRRLLSMHRMIMGGVADLDHKNLNVLDATKDNLRAATYQQNGWNKPKVHRSDRPSGSKYKGVVRCTRKNGEIYYRVLIKLTARDVVPSKYFRAGPFSTEDDAARAYNEKVKELRGEYAWLNPVPDEPAPSKTRADNES